MAISLSFYSWHEHPTSSVVEHLNSCKADPATGCIVLWSGIWAVIIMPLLSKFRVANWQSGSVYQGSLMSFKQQFVFIHYFGRNVVVSCHLWWSSTLYWPQWPGVARRQAGSCCWFLPRATQIRASGSYTRDQLPTLVISQTFLDDYCDQPFTHKHEVMQILSSPSLGKGQLLAVDSQKWGGVPLRKALCQVGKHRIGDWQWGWSAIYLQTRLESESV